MDSSEIEWKGTVTDMIIFMAILPSLGMYIYYIKMHTMPFPIFVVLFSVCFALYRLIATILKGPISTRHFHRKQFEKESAEMAKIPVSAEMFE